jgi:ribosomal protein L16 Arg81 hydroxylase
VLSYAGRLKEWGAALEHELPLEGIVPQPEGDTVIEVKPYVWLGQRGVRTPLHYDYYSNLYLQIVGRKRFVILPPSHHVGVDLYPSLHPAHRSSQIANFTAALTVNATSAAEPAYEVVLEPGDILYLPALWFHEVTTLDDVALSANVWCVCGIDVGVGGGCV